MRRPFRQSGSWHGFLDRSLDVPTPTSFSTLSETPNIRRNDSDQCWTCFSGGTLLNVKFAGLLRTLLLLGVRILNLPGVFKLLLGEPFYVSVNSENI